MARKWLWSSAARKTVKMKQSLSLQARQQLAITPQLRQAIRLMQLSSAELALEVRQAIEANPMLEEAEDAEDTVEEAAASEPEPSAAADAEDAAEWDEDGWNDETGDGAALDPANGDALPDDLPVDVRWEDLYQAAAPASATPAREGAELSAAATESLADHLCWQLNLLPVGERERQIGAAIVEAINADGMLECGVEELAAAVDVRPPALAQEVAAMLRRVQQFDPAGVGARDLRECLLLQLDQLPPDTPHLAGARRLLTHCFEALAARDRHALARRSQLQEAALDGALTLIQSLNPRPGAAVGDFACEYTEPDVFVRKERGRWVVELNPELAPRVRINGSYAGLVRRGDSSADNAFLREHLQEARWFLASLANRNETLLNVAAKVVEHQRDFLERGEEAMRPLVLAEIAAATGLHESTVSRATTRKYLHTPRGVFELKHFFSSHVTASDGREVSSTAVRAIIRQLIGEENARKPLSDSRIASILAKRNIEVARRTVAKYRESMSIPSSSIRRRAL